MNTIWWSIFSFIKQTKKKLKINKANLHEPYIHNDDVNTITLKQNQLSTYGKFTNIFENKLKYLDIENAIRLINGDLNCI